MTGWLVVVVWANGVVGIAEVVGGAAAVVVVVVVVVVVEVEEQAPTRKAMINTREIKTEMK
jgi:hypothetical protein